MFDFIEYVKETNLKIGERRGFRKGKREGFKKGFQEGFQEEQEQFYRTIVSNMLKRGYNHEEIQAMLEISETKLEAYLQDISKAVK